jgi:hypothetical protein
MDRGKELLDRFRVVGAFRVPVDDKGEKDPAVRDQQTARNRACVETRKIRIAALCVGADAKRQGQEINEIA